MSTTRQVFSSVINRRPFTYLGIFKMVFILGKLERLIFDHRPIILGSWKSHVLKKLLFWKSLPLNFVNLWSKSLKIDIFLFIDILLLFFEKLLGVGFHRVYTYYFKIVFFFFALCDMTHLCFTLKQDICSTECKKYTVNPVNTPWAYTGIKDKFDGSIIGGGLTYRGA